MFWGKPKSRADRMLVLDEARRFCGGGMDRSGECYSNTIVPKLRKSWEFVPMSASHAHWVGSSASYSVRQILTRRHNKK